MDIINITILIQIVNFFIAYIIIRTLLLKPVVMVIQEEEEQRGKLNETLQSITNANKKKEEVMAREWNTCKEQFDERAPKITPEQANLKDSSTEEIHVDQLDKNAVAPVAKLVTHELEERLSHVR